MATVNLEVRLDLKTIALRARNAEYNPKVETDQRTMPSKLARADHTTFDVVAFRGSDHENSGAAYNSVAVRKWQDGRHWR